MATIPNPTNRLITKGLGGPACQGLITMHFNLFHVSIGPIPPNGNVGGGGPYPYVGAANQATPQSNPLYYSLPNQDYNVDARYMMITVKIGAKEFTKHYVLDKNKAAIAISTLKYMKSAQVQVGQFKRMMARIGGDTKPTLDPEVPSAGGSTKINEGKNK